MNYSEVYNTVGSCSDNSISHAVYYVFLFGSPVVMLVSSVVVYTFFKIKDCRKPPGDLFLIISISDFILGAHWFTTALGSEWGFGNGTDLN